MYSDDVQKEVVDRIRRRAGQPLTRVRNPHITARESVALADYIVSMERYIKSLEAYPGRTDGDTTGE